MEMSEVADESGIVSPSEVLLEDIPSEQQQRFLSVKAGTLFDPIPRGDAFEVWRVKTRTETVFAGPIIRARLESRIINRCFNELLSNTLIGSSSCLRANERKDVDLLRRSALFRFLPDEHFEKIRSLLQEERHDFGDLIVKQGEPPALLYIDFGTRPRGEIGSEQRRGDCSGHASAGDTSARRP